MLKRVSVSNDGGVTWSREDTGFTRYLYSDVFASVSGDDTYGDGTAANPYASIQRAVMASLSGPRSSFEYSSLTTGQKYSGPPRSGMAFEINRDTIVLQDGRYTGLGNTGVYPMGRMLVISAANRGQTTIDCEYQVGSVFRVTLNLLAPWAGRAARARGGQERVWGLGLSAGVRPAAAACGRPGVGWRQVCGGGDHRQRDAARHQRRQLRAQSAHGPGQQLAPGPAYKVLRSFETARFSTCSLVGLDRHGR